MKTLLTQQDLAFQDGYTELFEFIEGQIHRPLCPGTIYPIIPLEKRPYPCLVTRKIVYRIKTSDGIKGVAVIDFNNDDD